LGDKGDILGTQFVCETIERHAAGQKMFLRITPTHRMQTALANSNCSDWFLGISMIFFFGYFHA
jgi:hypothetical protein